ncbi:MAG TPA: glycosyltransferase family 1 protein [Candidatus Margulisiibacteriota bacterium]|nr:glycosyltransferase family 1 protein [Candidatus Margulisiibacteriota bacterium]
MRIGFDARMITHPGIGRYIKNLLHALVSLDSQEEFILYGDPVRLSEFQGLRVREYFAPVYGWQELKGEVFRKDSLDVLHIPHFNAPFSGANNLVLTIHDLIYLKFTGSRSFLKGLVVKPLINRALSSARRIIAVSENTREDLKASFPKVDDKIKVIAEAPDPVFRPIREDVKREQVREKYNLPKEYMLFVGSLRLHKNIPGLIEAYANLKRKGLKWELVIVGRSYRNSGRILQKIKDNKVLFLGEIPSQDMVYIYNLAGLVVIPSFYEGFGLPVLEAMACGVPVASSTASSLPEVAKDAAVFFNPQDVEEMAFVLSGAINDQKLRQALSQAGIERAGNFSWKNTALETLKVYREAAARS